MKRTALNRAGIAAIVVFGLAFGVSQRPVGGVTPFGGAGMQTAGLKYDLSAMLMAFPELARMPAPAWVQPGMRLTYYQASAITAGEGPIFEEDPTGPIRATDGSGKRFRIRPGGRLDRDRYGGENLHGGSSGQGYADYTIVGVSPTMVAIAVDVYTITGAKRVPMLMSHAAFIGAPGSAMDLWVSPAWLKQQKMSMNSNLKVFRTTVRSRGATRPAVVFATANGTMMAMYDEETGVLLQHGGSGSGATGVNLRIDNQYIPNSPSRLFTIGELRDQRTLKLPWAGKQAPDWVQTTRSITYAGQAGLLVTGSPNIPLPCSLTLRTLARGNGWVRYQGTQSTGGASGARPILTQTQWMAGTDEIGGIWVPPSALSTLEAGREIDRNPVTGIVTTIGRRDRSPRGGDMVIVSRVGADQQIDYGYDMGTGMLIYFSHVVRGLAGSMYTRLVLRDAQ